MTWLYNSKRWEILVSTCYHLCFVLISCKKKLFPVRWIGSKWLLICMFYRKLWYVTKQFRWLQFFVYDINILANMVSEKIVVCVCTCMFIFSYSILFHVTFYGLFVLNIEFSNFVTDSRNVYTAIVGYHWCVIKYFLTQLQYDPG